MARQSRHPKRSSGYFLRVMFEPADERALEYDDNLIIRTSIDRYLSFLEASGYVIAPVAATEEMCRRSFIWPAPPAKSYAEMIAARPTRDASSCKDAG